MVDADPTSYPPPGVDLQHPNVARVYDYYLGGTANWAIDREFGDRIEATFPLVRPIAKANRLFLHRAVRYLVRHGVHQFVDIGAGVPTMGNTHAVADELAANRTRVVYIDNEPVAVAHSRLLIEECGDPARHTVVRADLRDPDGLWQQVLDTGLIDLDQPVGLLIIAVLHVQQLDRGSIDVGPQAVARYRALLPAGSYLALSHATDDGVPDDFKRQLAEVKKLYDAHSSPVIWRSRDEVAALFGNFELVQPGITWTPLWHPEEAGPSAPGVDFDAPNESVVLAGVGRKYQQGQSA